MIMAHRRRKRWVEDFCSSHTFNNISERLGSSINRKMCSLPQHNAVVLHDECCTTMHSTVSSCTWAFKRKCTWWDFNVHRLLSQLIEEPSFISKNKKQGTRNYIWLAKASIIIFFCLNIQELQTVFFQIYKFLMSGLQDRHKFKTTGVSICTCKFLICICKRDNVHRILIMTKRSCLDRNRRLLMSEDSYLHTVLNWKVFYIFMCSHTKNLKQDRISNKRGGSSPWKRKQT